MNFWYHKYIELLHHNPEIIRQNLYFLDYFSIKQPIKSSYDGIIIAVIKKICFLQKCYHENSHL